MCFLVFPLAFIHGQACPSHAAAIEPIAENRTLGTWPREHDFGEIIDTGDFGEIIDD
jgi:hypothetical protein